MTDLEKATVRLALEALKEINKLSVGENAICLPAEIDTAMDACREALAQPEQEPKKIPESWATHGGLWIEALYKHQRGE